MDNTTAAFLLALSLIAFCQPTTTEERQEDLLRSREARSVKDDPRPSLPRSLTIESYSNTTILLAWIKPEFNGENIFRYHVKVQDVDDVPRATTPLTRYTFAKLSPYKNFTLVVMASTEDNKQSDEASIQGHTDAGRPEECETFEGKSLRPTEVHLKWTRPRVPNGPISGYRFRWDGKEKKVGGDQLEDVVMGLKPYQDYTFEIAAYNTDQKGLQIPGQKRWFSLRMPVDKPDPVTKFEIWAASSREVKVTWEKPVDSKGPVNGYTLKWVESKNETVKDEKDFPRSDQKEFTIPDLKPYTKYNVSISAYNNQEEGGGKVEGLILTGNVQTCTEAPGKVQGLNLVSRTNSTLEWAWEAPSPETWFGPLDGFVARLSSNKTKELKVLKSNETSWKGERLVPFTCYNFTVVAYNLDTPTSINQKKLESEEETLESNTTVSAPSRVGRLEAKSMTNGEIVVRWCKPQTPNGPIDGYCIILRSFDGREEFKETVNGTQKEFAVRRELLQSFTEYLVDVTAFNIDEEQKEKLVGEKFIEEIRVTTYPEKPKKPQQMNLTATETEVFVEWEPPPDPRNPPWSYEVVIKKNSTGPFVSNTTKVTNHNFDGLSPWTNYSVSVFAFFEVKDLRGPKASKEVTTDTAAPNQPAPPTIISDSKTALRIEWKPPSPLTGITSCTVRLEEASPMQDDCTALPDTSWRLAEEWADTKKAVITFDQKKINVCYRARVTATTVKGNNTSNYSSPLLTSEDSTTKQPDIGMIVGIVVAVVFVIGASIGVAYRCKRRKTIYSGPPNDIPLNRPTCR